MVRSALSRAAVICGDVDQVDTTRVNPVERQHGARRGKGQRKFDACRHPGLCVESSGCGATPPGIHVAEQYRWTATKLRMPEQRAYLFVARSIRKGEMGCDHLEHASIKGNLRGDCNAFFETRIREVEHRYTTDGPTRKNRVAKFAPLVDAGGCKRHVHPQRLGERLEWIVAAMRTHDLLKRDDICSHFRDDEPSPCGIRGAPTVEPCPAMNVVGRHRDFPLHRTRRRCDRRRAQQAEMGCVEMFETRRAGAPLLADHASYPLIPGSPLFDAHRRLSTQASRPALTHHRPLRVASKPADRRSGDLTNTGRI